MHWSRLLIVLVLVASLGWSSLSCAESEVIVRVGAVPVTIYEWQRQVNRIFPLQANFHGGISEERLEKIRQQALDELIEQAYMAQYALAEELPVPNSLVDEKLAPIHEKYPDEKQFEAAFGAEGSKRFRSSLYRQLLAKKAEEVAVTERVKVTDADVKSYYETNKKRYMRPKQYEASHILIKVDPSSNAEEKKVLLERAEDLAAKAKAGEDFYNLAYFNSDDKSKFVGGKLGTFHAGQTVKEFDEAIQQMAPGEIRGPVKSMYGYHIIKLDKVDEPRQLSFEEMAPKIRQQLETDQAKALKEAWLADLKAKYPVERFDK